METGPTEKGISNTLPSLGVGITYMSELDPLINQGLVDYIEVEPQTLWMYKNGQYKMAQEVITHINNFKQRKLIHSVGLPVGGTFRGDIKQIDLLIRNITDFNVPWTSEHLGFNATSEFHTGFFLPPAQTEIGIKLAVDSINFLQYQLPVPFAVETGVNYLRPVKGQLPDGEFIARIITEADCGLLLDIHNLYANELNGRQTIAEFIKQIPVERVWEVHLAGGFEMDGFYLDAHSGTMPEKLIEIAYEVVSQLPNLKAITYELLPSYIPMIGLAKIENEMAVIKRIWGSRSKSSDATLTIKENKKHHIQHPDQSVCEWEETLGALVIGKPVSATAISVDPAISLVQKLIYEFRASMLVSVFRLTSRFLMLTLSIDVFKSILHDFWKMYPPKQFASEEALNFSAYLKQLDLKVPNLSKILEFEESTLLTLLDNETRIVIFDHDPFPLLRSLSEGELSTMARQKGCYEIEITGDMDNSEFSQRLSRNYLINH
jgi:uncharacterized protein